MSKTIDGVTVASLDGEISALNGYFSNSTPSTSPTTGAAVFAGGVGISGALNVAGAITTTSTTASTNATTGSGIFGGGVGVSGAINATGAVVASNVTSTNATDIVALKAHYTDTTGSTNPTTGAAVFAGGVGIQGAVFTAANIQTAGALITTSNTASTNATTGSGIFGGGVGVSGAINATGAVVASNVTSTNATDISTAQTKLATLFVPELMTRNNNSTATGIVTWSTLVEQTGSSLTYSAGKIINSTSPSRTILVGVQCTMVSASSSGISFTLFKDSSGVPFGECTTPAIPAGIVIASASGYTSLAHGAGIYINANSTSQTFNDCCFSVAVLG